MRRRALVLGVPAAAALAGCALMIPPVRVPMVTLRPDAGPCPAPAAAPALLVMLPGAYSRPAEFVDEGFVGAVRRHGSAADVLVADAHLGYYEDRSVLQRLHEDVIGPARAQADRRLWLVGISLGGFGALAYAMRHRDEVDGIVVLAPYLGRAELQQEIAGAGGPAAWRGVPHARTPDDLDRELWEWLVDPAAPRPPIYLGCGRDDRFIASARALATVLPPDRYAEAPGGHDWPAWRALWDGWLDRGLLPGACSVPG